MEVICTTPKSGTADGFTRPEPNNTAGVVTLRPQNDVFKHLDYIDVGMKPPFTRRQLLIMAIMSSSTKFLWPNGMIQWILDNFEYYDAMHDRHMRNWLAPPEECPCMISLTLCGEERLLYTPFKFVPDQGYTLVHGEEETILHDTVSNRRFSILKLPLELRIIIYNFALTFPCDGLGWTVSARGTIHTLHGRMNGRYIEDVEPKEMLSLTAVSRQIYNETIGIYYSENAFAFFSLSDLFSFLCVIGKRRSFLRKIAIYYCCYSRLHFTEDRTIASKVFNLLQEHVTLRSLHLVIDEVELLKWNKKFKGPQDFPGFKQLIQIRGLKELTFHGNFHQTKQYLELKILEPKK